MVAESFKRSHRMIALCVALAFATAALALGFAVTADAQEESGSTPQPTIQSDKDDYPPGGTVILTGTSWQPGESVNIVVDDDGVDERDWQRDVTVTADENGNIRDEFQLPNWFVANYTVKATGAQSGVATTAFTDAPAKIEGKDSGGVNYRSTGGPLRDWDELEKIPMRLAFTETGTRTVTVTFSHTSNSGRRIPGIKDLVEWTPANSKVTSVNAQLTDTSGEEWAYTVVANLASGTNNSNPGYVEFKAILAAGSHAYPGGSLHVNLSGDGTGTMQINPSDVIAANPDLVVDKTGPATAAPGSTIEYKLNYKNTSTTDTATGAVITDILPSGVTFDSCSDSCTVAGNEVSWVIGNLAPGTGTDPNNQLSRTLRVKIPQNATNGTSYVNNTDILSADAEQDLGNCGAADSDNNADNDTPACDNYDSLKTSVAVNGSPNAANDSYNVNEDGTLNVADGPNDVLANDTDPDNDTLTVTGNTQPAHGSVTVNANGSFNYTPSANYSGPASFDYTVSDGKGGTATGTVNITVNAVNDKPVAVNDNYSVNEDITLTKNASDGVLDNDTDVEGSGLTAVLVGGPSHGTVSLNNDGSFSYTPASNYNGPDSFTYKASDGSDESDLATVNITVDPVNDAPVNSVPGTQNIDEDQPRIFSVGNGNAISISDPDAGNDDVQVTLSAEHGRLSLGGITGLVFSGGDGVDDSTMTFTGPITAINTALNLSTFAPDANYDGTGARLTIVTDDQGNNGSGGAKSDTDSVAFDITAENDPPVIGSVVVTNTNPVEEGSPATIEVTATDPDTPSSELRYSFDCDDDGTFEKGPQAANTAECTYSDNGNRQVNVKVSDDADNSDTDSTNVTVVNVAPAATFDAAPNSIDEGQNINLSLTNVVDPGTEDTHEYRFDCGNGFGAWGGSSTSSCPTTDDGQITVKGQVRDDDGGLSQIYTETITVNNAPPNVDPPDQGPNGENQGSDEGQNGSFDLGSFTDPGADGPWNVTVNWGDGSQPSNFQVPEGARLQDGSFDLSGQHLYDDNGEYDVTVTVAEDGPNAASDQASFKITVNNVNPTALLANDGPIDENESATVSFSGQADPSGADNSAGLRYAYNCDGRQFTTIPNYADLAGNGDSKECSFADDGSYTVRGLIMDKDGGYNVYATQITVDNAGPSGKDRIGPTGEDGAYTTPEETEVQVVLEADNPGIDNLSFIVENGPANGTLSGTGANLTYTPGADFNGTDSFTFEVCDDDEPKLCDTGTVEIIVTPINDAPVGTNDERKTPEDTSLVLSAAGLTANDGTGAGNEGGQSLNITEVSEPENGAVNLSGGQITFTPDQNYNGPASFKYTVCDNGQPTPECSVVKVTVLVTVTEVNDPPTAALDEITTEEDQGITFDPKTNDAKGPQNEGTQSLVVDSIATRPGHGTATLLASGPNAGQVSYTPDANFNGNDEFTYKVCDDGTTDGQSAPECAVGTVRVTVNPVNDDPTINKNFELDPTMFEDRDTGTLGFIVGDPDLDSGSQQVASLAQQTGLDSLTVTASSNRQPLVKDQNIVLGGSGANRTITITPDTDRSGKVEITLSVDDGEGGTAETSFEITVRPVDDKPSFSNIGAVLSDENEGNVTRNWASAFDMGADDENGRDDANDLQRLLKQDLVEFNLVPANLPNASNPLAFAVAPTIGNDGKLRYRTKANDFGTAAFRVTMKDNGSLNTDSGLDPQDVGVAVSDAALLTINVRAVNDLPKIVLDQDGARLVNEGSVRTYTYTITDDESIDEVTESCGRNAQLRQDTKVNSFQCFFPDGPATTEVSVLAKAPSLEERSLAAAALTDRFTVGIRNVAPRVSISGPDKAVEGRTKTFKFRITDPGRDTFSLVSGYPKCGDGAKLVSKKLTGASGVFECEFVRGPAKPLVALKVKDSDGTASSEATKRVAVAADKDDSCAHRPNGADTDNAHGDIDDGTDAGTSNTDVHNPCRGETTTN